MESTDYDLFDYKNFDAPSLGLSEAMSKAASLRKAQPENFYRVVAANKEKTAFRVEEISRDEVYLAIRERILQRWLNFRHRRSS